MQKINFPDPKESADDGAEAEKQGGHGGSCDMGDVPTENSLHCHRTRAMTIGGFTPSAARKEASC